MSLVYTENGDRAIKDVAFTFDDGPNPHATTKIMDILEAHGIKGAFFVIGLRAEQNPELLLEIHKRGHLIGNHTYSHSIGDFKRSDVVLSRILGFSPQYIRPPFYNLDFCKDELDFLSDKKIITGDINSEDYLDIDSNQVFLNSTLNTINGSIIDFHDGSELDADLVARADKTIGALPMIIQSLNEKGYSVKRLDEMSLFCQPVKWTV